MERKYHEHNFKNNKVLSKLGNAQSLRISSDRAIPVNVDIGISRNGPRQLPDIENEGTIMDHYTSEIRIEDNNFYQTNTIGRASLGAKSRTDLMSLGSNRNRRIESQRMQDSIKNSSSRHPLRLGSISEKRGDITAL